MELEDHDTLLEMRNVTKRFPGVTALNNVSLKVKKGEVLALMGENGAGKSTLMKILAGVYQPDEGEINLKGRKVEFHKPIDSIHNGISMIHQELSFIPEMTVTENIFIGREPTYKYSGIFSGIVNKKLLRAETKKLFEQLEIDIDPDTKMSSLSVASMQVVEIVKAISHNADVIIMDEPTSAITDREVEKLFEIIEMLTSQGKGIIYISHKMDEIFQIADHITVLRDGEYVGTKLASELDEAQLISMMVGRNLNDIFDKGESIIGDVVFEVKNLTRVNEFSDISFKVHRGEILGIAGLVGAGRTEIAESIFGVRKLNAGEIMISGKRAAIHSPKDAIKHGVALVTEDRKLFGLNLKASVKNNVTLVKLKDLCKMGIVIDETKEKTVTDEQIKKFGVKTHSRNTIINHLSGGNQQKVILAKWLLNEPSILILDEPTRGIDVGAKAEIYRIMGELARNGMSIIMISSEMPELFGMSDRIIVMSQGKITGEFGREEFNQEEIMACCTGKLKEELVS